MINEKILKNEEAAVFALRSLYGKYGYLPFKMSKFEEYELYIRNKNFLVSDRIITFNDTNGRLLALKPDVTLSIIKNGEDAESLKQKVCYNENVYRVSESTGNYKEIMQTGLECIGDLDLYDIFECVSLAAQSLALISDKYLLEVSHLGILSAVLDEVCANEAFAKEALSLIAGKNEHDLRRLCAVYGVSEADTDRLCVFITAYGDRKTVLSKLRGVSVTDRSRAAYNELLNLSSLLDSQGFGSEVIFDFSVVNDMNYYNGIVFNGFIDGLSDSVLAGGQYDNLMRRMGRKSKAVGFAIYLDELAQLDTAGDGVDVDVLLLYDDSTDEFALADKVRALADSGKRVSAQKAVPPSLRSREIIDLRGGKKPC